MRRTTYTRHAAKPLTVLLTDGSSLASRQIATALSWGGHHVEAVDPNPLCLARMTRHVGKVHPVPSFGDDPVLWLAAVLRLLEARRFDVLFPTQEQAALLAKVPEQIRRRGTGVAVPPFEALAAVQDKVVAEGTLDDLGTPRPHTLVAHSVAELLKSELPVFVKRAIGTASNGVQKVSTVAELRVLAEELDGDGAFDEGVVAQQPVDGPLIMVQALYDHGVLVASHYCERVREGAGGGASAKESRDLPELQDPLVEFGQRLGWHAAVSFDVILTKSGPKFIDVNPRLVEPMNALFAGMDLVSGMLQLSREEPASVVARGRTGIRTHQILLALLGAARDGRGRAGVLSELWAGITKRGQYQGSAEELTPLRGDVLAPAPVVYSVARLLASPGGWADLSSGAVGSYALSPEAWRCIKGLESTQL